MIHILVCYVFKKDWTMDFFLIFFPHDDTDMLWLLFFIRKSDVMTLQRALCHFWQSLGVHFTFLWCQVKCSIFSCHLETSWTAEWFEFYEKRQSLLGKKTSKVCKVGTWMICFLEVKGNWKLIDLNLRFIFTRKISWKLGKVLLRFLKLLNYSAGGRSENLGVQIVIIVF